MEEIREEGERRKGKKGGKGAEGHAESRILPLIFVGGVIKKIGKRAERRKNSG